MIHFDRYQGPMFSKSVICIISLFGGEKRLGLRCGERLSCIDSRCFSVWWLCLDALFQQYRISNIPPSSWPPPPPIHSPYAFPYLPTPLPLTLPDLLFVPITSPLHILLFPYTTSTHLALLPFHSPYPVISTSPPLLSLPLSLPPPPSDSPESQTDWVRSFPAAFKKWGSLCSKTWPTLKAPCSTPLQFSPVYFFSGLIWRNFLDYGRMRECVYLCLCVIVCLCVPSNIYINKYNSITNYSAYKPTLYSTFFYSLLLTTTPSHPLNMLPLIPL